MATSLYSRIASRASLYAGLLQGVVENPRYYRFVMHRGWYDKIVKQLAKHDLPAHKTFYPAKLDLRIMYACNLRCKMCGQWGENGTYFEYGTPRLQRTLELKAIERVVEQLAPHGLQYVDIEGGEPFLHPHVIDLFRMLKSYGLLVKPVTNGTLLKQYAKEVVDCGLDAIHVSVDGDRDSHNMVRQATWAYDRTMEGLSAVSTERRRAGRRTPLLVICFTMTRHNTAASLRKLCQELHGKRLIDVLSIKAGPIWIPQHKGEAYDRLIERYFGRCALTSWRGFTEDYRDFHEGAREAAQTIRDLKAGNYDFFVHAVPSIPLEEVPKLYGDYDWNLGRPHCPIPYAEPTIDADGNVYPCNLFTDEALSMGNIYEQPFLDIWFGKRYTTFRQMLADQGGLLPICNRCCQLTEH